MAHYSFIRGFNCQVNRRSNVGVLGGAGVRHGNSIDRRESRAAGLRKGERRIAGVIIHLMQADAGTNACAGVVFGSIDGC